MSGPRADSPPGQAVSAAALLATAEDALALAEALAGKGGPASSDRAFLVMMARSDAQVDHDGETCGMCHHQVLQAQVAREMLAAGEVAGAMDRWAVEAERRWRDGKFYKLWAEETAAGRDPRAAFAALGWEP